MPDPLDPALSGMRILLVEDDGIIAILLKSMLASLRCDVIGLAVRVPDALKKVGTLSFDLALLDVNLAGTLSYPVAGALQTRGIPFIFTTSYGRSALPPEMATAPVLSKPFNLPQLSAALMAIKPEKPAEAHS
jgi:CheY-like chemotaxis protein